MVLWPLLLQLQLHPALHVKRAQLRPLPLPLQLLAIVRQQHRQLLLQPLLKDLPQRQLLQRLPLLTSHPE